MSLSSTADQSAELSPGVWFVDMEGGGAGGARFDGGAAVAARAGGWLARRWRRLGFGWSQWLITLFLRRGLSLRDHNPAAYRAFTSQWRERLLRPDDRMFSMADVEAVRVAGPHLGLPPPPAPAEWFAPRKGEPEGFVFYVHGGSFVAERSPRITAVVARFAAAAGARVFAPSYRLAPEHPCPAAVDDIVAAFRWFREAWPDEPVVALAESAGASILLAALQRVAAEGGAMPVAVLLLSPWVDLSLQSLSVIAASLFATSPYTMESMALMAHLYLQGRPATDPVASPLFGEFRGFPPILIHASQGDILYDDAVRLADKVRDAGGDLTVRLWTAESHVWEQNGTTKARQSIELGADFIRRHLRRAAGRGFHQR